MLGKITLILVLWVVSLILELVLVNLFLRFYNYFGFDTINTTKYPWIIDIIHFVLLINPLIIIAKIIL